MSLITPTPPTDDELQRAAETPGVEFADGELREKAVSLESDRVATNVAFVLMSASKPTRAGTVFVEAGYRCYAEDPRGRVEPRVPRRR